MEQFKFAVVYRDLATLHSTDGGKGETMTEGFGFAELQEIRLDAIREVTEPFRGAQT